MVKGRQLANLFKRINNLSMMMNKRMKMTKDIVVEEVCMEVALVLVSRIKGNKYLLSNNRKISKAHLSKLVDFVVDMTLISMKNLWIFIIGKSVLGLLNAGNAAKSLKFSLYMIIYWKNVILLMSKNCVRNAREFIELNLSINIIA